MENKTENRLCLKCQVETPHYHNKGISKKTGKPYENYKCSVCQETEWVNSEQEGKDNPKPIQYPAKPYRPINLKEDKIGEGQAKGAAFNKAVDVVIAAYNKGEIKFEEIPEEVIKVHEAFKKINVNGNEA